MHIIIAKGSSFHEVWLRGLEEMHPPGSHFIRHLLLSLDDSLITNRLLSIIPAIISVVLIYFIGTIICNPSIGMLLATFQLFSPIAVTYSISIRNYALFILFLYSSVLFLVLYFKNRDKKYLLLYAFFIFLACFTHFSGFIVLAASGSTLVLLFALEKRFDLLRICILIHLPHLLIAILFYQAYFSLGSVGAGWREFLLTNPVLPTFRNSDFPLHYRILHLFYGFFVKDPIIALMLTFFSIYGICICWLKNKALAILIFFLFLIQITLSIFEVYPISGNRYNYHLFLFVTITLGFFVIRFQELFKKYLSYKFFEALLILVIVVLTFYFHYEQPHLKNNYELPLTKNTYSSGIKYLQSSVKENEIVITNKIGGLYLNFDKYHGNVMYQHKPISNIHFKKISVWYQAQRYLWEYQTPQNFEGFLTDLSQKLPNNSAKKVWFLTIGLSDFALNTIYYCDSMKAFIKDEFFEDGFLIFSIRKDKLLPLNSDNKEQLKKCWGSSKVPGNAYLLRAPLPV